MPPMQKITEENFGINSHRINKRPDLKQFDNGMNIKQQLRKRLNEIHQQNHQIYYGLDGTTKIKDGKLPSLYDKKIPPQQEDIQYKPPLIKEKRNYSSGPPKMNPFHCQSKSEIPNQILIQDNPTATDYETKGE